MLTLRSKAYHEGFRSCIARAVLGYHHLQSTNFLVLVQISCKFTELGMYVPKAGFVD